MRRILHVDMNSFYASVEQAYDPSLRGKAMAVVGSVEDRHGIILAKSAEAKAKGVRTGEAIWEAKNKCPELITVEAHFDRYVCYSRLAHSLYLEYTNQVEPYGMDECWMDVTGSVHLFGEATEIARAIRTRIRKELGVTVSIGISDNKFFAKLGSDYRKPDAQTVFDATNYQEKVWPLPVGDLLFAGRRTTAALQAFGIQTIGDLARADPALIHHRFGLPGTQLRLAARGEDKTPVADYHFHPPTKSIGCGTTFRRDLVTEREIRLCLLKLAEDVEKRLIEEGLAATRLSVTLRDPFLEYTGAHGPLSYPTQNAGTLGELAFALTMSCKHPNRNVRALMVRAESLLPVSMATQTLLFSDIVRHDKRERVSQTIHALRARFGRQAAERASLSGFVLADIDSTRAKMPVNAFAALRRTQAANTRKPPEFMSV